MNFEQFKWFCNTEQNESITETDWKNIIENFEKKENCKKDLLLSSKGFTDYLNDHNQFIFDLQHNKVYQDMNLPIFKYFINSSHNTYLTGDQLTSESSADHYRSTIMNGARLLESKKEYCNEI